MQVGIVAKVFGKNIGKFFKKLGKKLFKHAQNTMMGAIGFI
jgi:hypothetical protein